MKTLIQTFLIAAARTRSVLDQIFFHSPIKLVETGWNHTKHDQTGWNWMKPYKTLSNWLKLDEIGSNWWKLDEPGSNWMKPDKMDETGWKGIKLVETGSHRLKLDETWKKQIRYLTLNKVKEVETIERKMSMIYWQVCKRKSPKEKKKIKKWCNSCDTVGRVVTYDAKELTFESNQRQYTFLLFNTITHSEMFKIKKKKPRMAI